MKISSFITRPPTFPVILFYHLLARPARTNKKRGKESFSALASGRDSDYE
jgi:preprotein translocase subunit YajC